MYQLFSVLDDAPINRIHIVGIFLYFGSIVCVVAAVVAVTRGCSRFLLLLLVMMYC